MFRTCKNYGYLQPTKILCLPCKFEGYFWTIKKHGVVSTWGMSITGCQKLKRQNNSSKQVSDLERNQKYSNGKFFF